jgi:hypothetical protein
MSGNGQARENPARGVQCSTSDRTFEINAPCLLTALEGL